MLQLSKTQEYLKITWLIK